MRFTHYKEFEGLEEIALVIDYEYEPAQREIIQGDPDDCQEGIAENAVIGQVSMNIYGNFSSITSLITDSFMEELVELAIEDYTNQGEG